MQLASVRLIGVGPFEDLLVPFADDDGRPRRVTVVFGGGGVGKTTLLSAIAATRPGHAVALSAAVLGAAPPGLHRARSTPPQAICEYFLGQDDSERPHTLPVGSPGARLGESDEEETFRRREQALFDKRAAAGGFAFLSLPAHRFFSRQPLAFSAPGRTVARYDVRGQTTLDEATRADMTRETKQALAYAGIGAALSQKGNDRGRRLDLLGSAMHSAVDHLVALAGFEYAGLDPATFEPLFVDAEGRERFFDALPTRARHLVAFAALGTRLLFAAHPGADPRTAEGIVAIDEVDLYQDAAAAAGLVGALTRALPGVQWLLTTSSPVVVASVDARDVVALRRATTDDRVELYVGDEARTH
ncbi:MAG: hypothetical protein IPI67_09530 [Myxococcales bacterium]|nr:hypothetical protein [Myxococcales bacterium]